MTLRQRLINALSGQTTNRVENKRVNGFDKNAFLKYGNRQDMLPNWSYVNMDDEDIYKGYPYAVIQKRANKVATLARENLTTWVNEETQEEYDKREEEPLHPYLKLIEDSTTFSVKQFWKTICIYLDLAGAYYLAAVRTRIPSKSPLAPDIYGDIQKFILLNPYEVKRVINNDGLVAGYIEHKPDGREREWPVHMIIPMRELNPFRPDTKVWSMTDAAKESVYTLNQSSNYTRETLGGNLSAPGIITTDVLLDDEQFENFRTRIVNHVKGEPLFGNGTGAINWQNMQTDLDKSALNDINEINRTTLFAVSGTSKTSLGIEQSGTTRETARVQVEQFISDTVQPRLEDIVDYLNLDYKRYYPREYKTTGYWIDIKSAASRDYQTETQATQMRQAQSELALKLAQSGYTLESAYDYAEGKIELSELQLKNGLDEPENPDSGSGTPPQDGGDTPNGDDSPEDDKDIVPEENVAQNGSQSVQEALIEREGLVPHLELNDAKERLNILLRVAREVVSEMELDVHQDTSEKTDDYARFLQLVADKLGVDKLDSDDELEISPIFGEEVHRRSKVANENTGWVGIKVEPVEVTKRLGKYQSKLYEGDLGKEKTNIPGQENPHFTLAYGLQQKALDRDWDLFRKDYLPESVEIESIEVFDNDDPYQIIVATLKDNGLSKANKEALEGGAEEQEFEYKPHLTLCYVSEDADEIAESFADLVGMKLRVVGIDVSNPFENGVDSCSCCHGDKFERLKNRLNKADGETLEETYQTFLDDLLEIQNETYKACVSKLTINAFTEDDIIGKVKKKTLLNKLKAVIQKYWWVLTPLIANSVLDERNQEYGESVRFVFTNAIQKKVEDNASRVAEGHLNTILKDILSSANKAFTDITEKKAAELIVEAYKTNAPKYVKYFGEQPSMTEALKAIRNTDILEENRKIYERANELALQGYSREQIIKAIRNEYKQVSEKRADLIARNETARAYSHTQYEADYQFLNSIGQLETAMKRMVSLRPDNEKDKICPLCQYLINLGPIPFTQNFLNLGDTVSVNNDGKMFNFVCNYENIEAGCNHPNCMCRYELILNGKTLNELSSVEPNPDGGSDVGDTNNSFGNDSKSVNVRELNGGKGSGNFGHSGRPGEVGGSGKGGVSKGVEEYLRSSYFSSRQLPKSHDEIIGAILEKLDKRVIETWATAGDYEAARALGWKSEKSELEAPATREELWEEVKKQRQSQGEGNGNFDYVGREEKAEGSGRRNPVFDNPWDAGDTYWGPLWDAQLDSTQTYSEYYRDAKDRATKVIEIVPEVYLDILQKGGHSEDMTHERLRQDNPESIEFHRSKIRNNEPIATPTMSIESDGKTIEDQEGRHRVEAAILEGVKKVPVMVGYHPRGSDINRFLSDFDYKDITDDYKKLVNKHFEKETDNNSWKGENRDPLTRNGGKGSGNFGHAGRPGKVGGSASDSMIANPETKVTADWLDKHRDYAKAKGFTDEWIDQSVKDLRRRELKEKGLKAKTTAQFDKIVEEMKAEGQDYSVWMDTVGKAHREHLARMEELRAGFDEKAQKQAVKDLESTGVILRSADKKWLKEQCPAELIKGVKDSLKEAGQNGLNLKETQVQFTPATRKGGSCTFDPVNNEVVIRLTREWLIDTKASELRARTKGPEGSKWWTNGKVNTASSHECGHAMVWQVIKNQNLTPYAYERYCEKIVSQANDIFARQSGDDYWKIRGELSRNEGKKYISEYGSKNAMEVIAESYNNPNYSAYTKIVNDLVKDGLTGKTQWTV